MLSRWSVRCGGVALAGSVAVLAGVGSAYDAPTAVAETNCPALYVLGVQGTGQSSDNASTTADSGMLASVMSPMLSMAKGLVAREYVPYPAGFGGAVAGGKQQYSESVTQAMGTTTSMLSQIARRCGKTQFGLTGYSQGAHAMSNVAKSIGQGQGPIDADRVAGVALFGDPGRPADSPLFPGASGQDRPAAAPGTSGQSVASLPSPGPTQGPEGGGIAPTMDSDRGYGNLSGRVMDSCASGDLACAAPSNSPIVHLVTNIAGQSELDQADPIGSLTSVGQALALTSVKAGVDVINNDVQGTSLDTLSYEPQESVSQRLADASDPRTPLPSVPDALNAVLKVGTIGLNAVVSVAKKVITPQTIGELATVGLANPPAALAVLGAKLGSAVVDLVPPATVDRWTNQAFDAIKQNITDNKDLLNVTTMMQYFNTANAHGSYTTTSQTAGAPSPTLFAAEWFAALAHDLAGSSFSSVTGDGYLNTAAQAVSDSVSKLWPSATVPPGSATLAPNGPILSNADPTGTDESGGSGQGGVDAQNTTPTSDAPGSGGESGFGGVPGIPDPSSFTPTEVPAG